MKKYLFLCFVCFFAGTSGAVAASITYSGSDLYYDPTVSFPNPQPTLDGDSLVFGPSTTSPVNKLLVLPLFAAGHLSETSPTTVSIHINLTRLPCVPSVGCAVGSIEDNDQFIVLGDGTNLVGANVSDGVYDGYDGVGNASILNDLGDTAEVVPNVGVRLFTDSGYPDIYSSFDVFITITLDVTTSVDLALLAGSGSASGLVALDRRSAIDFVFLNEGDPGEQYQINSLTISSPALVPIPPALWLFGSGLLGLIWVTRKK